MRQRNAFTLIELLVVVAIIVALLAILMPSMSKAVEAAHRAVCASQQHQMHTAHLAWAGDHVGNLVRGQPALPHANVNIGQYSVWLSSLSPGAEYQDYGKYLKQGVLVHQGYLPDGRTFYCPSWSNPVVQYGVSDAPNSAGGGWFDDLNDKPATQTNMITSYHYNSQFGSSDYNVASAYRGARLTDPGGSALMADAFSWGRGGGGVRDHHLVGYNVATLGGSVAFFDDPEHLVRDMAGGPPYHAGATNYAIHQSKAWRRLEGRE